MYWVMLYIFSAFNLTFCCGIWIIDFEFFLLNRDIWFCGFISFEKENLCEKTFEVERFRNG